MSSHPLSGGDVAQSFRLALDDGRMVFAKTHPNPPLHFFDTEARGLTWLSANAEILVPAVLGNAAEPPLLVLQWIEEGTGPPADERAFGSRLAEMHSQPMDMFGRLDRRTTGSRGLPNEPCVSWSEFYATQRLLPLARLGRDTDTFDSDEVALIESVALRLDVVGGPTEPPSGLHGDLWAGNRVTDVSGNSWLIDPAFHAGHREFDLAMMRLFGGFSADVFAAYDDTYRLSTGWQERVELHQLAPLLVHAIKFGGSYRPAAFSACRRYL